MCSRRSDRFGKAYLGFARAEPAYYSAMFEAGIPASASPGLRDAGERAFAVLREAAEALCAQMPPKDRPPALMVALHLWAMAHGVASLFGRGDAARRALPMSPEELLEADMLIYLRGLGSAGAELGHWPRRIGFTKLRAALTCRAWRYVNVIYIHT